jgi:hypothetical protein
MPWREGRSLATEASPLLPNKPYAASQEPNGPKVKRPSNPAPETPWHRIQLLLSHISTPHMDFWQRKKTDNHAQPHRFINGLIPPPESLVTLNTFVFAEVAFQLIQFFVLDKPSQNQANKWGNEYQDQDE